MFFMKKKRTWLPVFVAALSLATISCKYDKEDPPSCTPAVSFSATILPLVTTKCAIAGCHDATASGGRVFQSYSAISAAKDRIHVRAVVEKTMPQIGSLSVNEITALQCWIDAGAPDN